MPLKIKSVSGSVTLDAQNVSGDQTLTIPSLSGGKTLLTTDGDGSSLTGVGVDGIVSSANATAITITSTELVGIGMTPTTRKLEVNDTIRCKAGEGFEFGGNVNGVYNTSNDIFIKTNSNERFRVTSDGRGLSQFTAKAWLDLNGQSTPSIRDSHNISSISDNNTGWYYANYTNNLGSSNGAAVASASNSANTFNCDAGTSVQNSGYVSIQTWGNQTGTSHAAFDFERVYVVVFGD